MARLLRKHDSQGYGRSDGRRIDVPEASEKQAENSEYDAEFECLMSNQINEEYIISITGTKNVSKIEYISLTIDTKEQSLYDLADILPNLKHLVLDNSHISSVRDLGIGLRFITSLSLSSCNLRDLDGIGVLEALQELCVSDNLLDDIAPLTLHENLQNLNLTNNRLTNLSFGFVLSSCSRLRSLFLAKNPIDRIRRYRAVVSHLVPGLEMLDGVPVDQQLATKITSSVLEEVEDELRVIEEEIEEERRLNDDIFDLSREARSDHLLMPIAPSTNAGFEILPDNGSELTHGTGVVLAGNMAAAMRKRRVDSSSTAALSAITTVDLLDSALLSAPASNRSQDQRMLFMSEGDVTELIMGSPQRGLGSEHKLRFDAPTAAASPHKQANHTSNRNSTVRSSSTVSASFEPEGSLFAVRKERPKSAFSGSALRSSDKSYEQQSASNSPVKSLEDGGTGVMEPSPRQRNSSRPQSAAAVGHAEVNALFSGRSLPFAVGSSDIAQSTSSQQLQGWGTKRLVGVRTDEDGDIGHASAGSSLVHLNIVRRQHKESVSDIHHAKGDGKLAQGIATLTIQETDDEDDEDDIGIAHSDRHRRMAQENNSSTNAQMLRQRQGVLDKLKGSKGSNERQLIDQLAADGTPVDVLDKMFSSKKHDSNIPVASSMSTTAGKSLGFNLVNSLAAIDKWVEDVSDGDHDNEGSDTNNIDEEGDDKQEHDDFIIFSDSTPRRPSSRENTGVTLTTPRSGSAKDKILSRDAIFQMCWNSSGKRSESRPDSAPTQDGSVISDEGLFNKRDISCSNSESIRSKETRTRNVTYDVAESVTTPTASSAPRKARHDGKDEVKEKVPPILSKSSSSQRTAVQLSDDELVDLLRKPPKSVVVLRTKASFQEFFRDVEIARFQRLLSMAYADIPDAKDREAKINRRLSLMSGVE